MTSEATGQQLNVDASSSQVGAIVFSPSGSTSAMAIDFDSPVTPSRLSNSPPCLPSSRELFPSLMPSFQSSLAASKGKIQKPSRTPSPACSSAASPSSTTSSSSLSGSSSSSQQQQAKKRKKRKTDFLSREMIAEYIHYSQAEAAKKLGISVSSLKRRFYELNMGIRWPSYKNAQQRAAFVLSTMPNQSGGMILVPSKEQLDLQNQNSRKKVAIDSLTLKSNVEEKFMDQGTVNALEQVFKKTMEHCNP